MATASQTLRTIVAPLVESMGYDLDDLQVSPAGRRRLVRVVIDADGGVTLDGAAEVSRAVSSALDDSDAMPGASYVLEVTSRGVDRPLTLPRHWRRNVGRLIQVDSVAEASETPTHLTGRLVEADDDGARLEIAEGGTVTVPYANVRRALVQVELNPHN